MRAQLAVDGMTCAGYVARIEKSLNRLDGVGNSLRVRRFRSIR
jgi:copper chaperone CopZ